MKSAEEILREQIELEFNKGKEGTPEFQKHVIDTLSKSLYTIEAMKAYAREALKEAAEQGRAEMITELNGDEYPVIDKESITNIELK